jgi:hypothetical protein
MLLLYVSCYESNNGNNLPEDSVVSSPNAGSGKGTVAASRDTCPLVTLDTIATGTVLLAPRLGFAGLDIVPVIPPIPFQEGRCKSSHQIEHTRLSDTYLACYGL